MSEILKKLKSVFIVEEDAAKSAQTPQTNQAPQTPQPTPVTTTHAQSTSSGGAISEKFTEILFAAIEKNNQEGFDFFEFKQALKNLSKMPMDEATRYQSAYAMAQTMGVTPVKLVESAKHYLNVLAGEQAKFNEAHAQQRARMIGNREDEVRNHEAMIQQKAEQIKELTRQIEEHRQKSEQIRSEINESTVKIENTKADFEATFVLVAGQIQEDINRIQQHLK